MKRRILAIGLILCFAINFAVPAFASDINESEEYSIENLEGNWYYLESGEDFTLAMEVTSQGLFRYDVKLDGTPGIYDYSCFVNNVPDSENSAQKFFSQKRQEIIEYPEANDDGSVKFDTASLAQIMPYSVDIEPYSTIIPEEHARLIRSKLPKEYGNKILSKHTYGGYSGAVKETMKHQYSDDYSIIVDMYTSISVLMVLLGLKAGAISVVFTLVKNAADELVTANRTKYAKYKVVLLYTKFVWINEKEESVHNASHQVFYEAAVGDNALVEMTKDVYHGNYTLKNVDFFIYGVDNMKK